MRPFIDSDRIRDTGRRRRASMKNVAFDEFVKSQQAPAQPEIDWNKRRDEWLINLDKLYSLIRGFLKEYIDSDQMQFKVQPIELYEENIGSYTAKQLALKIGRRKVLFQPAGTCLSGGAKGRVDVVGPSGANARLLLVDSNAKRTTDVLRVFLEPQGKKPISNKKEPAEELAWKIATRPPERRFIEITQETFFEMIMEVANG
jgi:hypothetical protein